MHAEEGFIIGNGDLSCSVYQTADEIVFRLGKGDVWDRRVIYEGSPRPAHIREFIYGELKEGWKSNPFDGNKTDATKGTKNEKRMKELCQGSSPVTKNWPYPCPKPTGEIRMHLPSDLPGPMKIEQKLFIEDARLMVSVSWANDVKVIVEAVIPYDENVLALKWQTLNWNDETYMSNRNMPVWFAMTRWQDPDIRTYAEKYYAHSRHGVFTRFAKSNPKITTLPPPKAFMDGLVGCIEQSFYPDNIFTNGFRCRLSLQLDPKKVGRASMSDSLKGLAKDAWIFSHPSIGNGSGELALKVTTSRDASLKATSAKSYADYRKATVEPANAFWKDRAFTIFGDKFLEDLWYVTCHVRRSVLRGGTVPPGLFLPSTVGDYSFWHGDYHGNYNMQSIYWGNFTANMLDQESAYFDTVEFALPVARKIARDYYGTRGLFFQLEGFPLHGDDDHNGMLPLGRMAYMTGWFPEPYWEWYKMTLDREFLAKRGYPLIRDCALFYLDFLKKAPHPDLPPQLNDGKYHVFPSIQGESGFSGNPMDVCDKGQALAHCRHNLYMAIEASKALGVDEDLRKEWQERLDNLYWTHTRNSFKGPNAAYDFHCYMCSPPEQMGRVWAPEKEWDGKPVKPGRNEHWYQGIRTWDRISQVRNNDWITARDYPYLVNVMKKWSHANGLVWAMAIGRYGRAGAWTETLSVAAPFQEMLLQSWDGSIRLFPRWPKGQDVSFRGWRAEGAFLVSAEQKGDVQTAQVFSEKGADCLVLGTWKVADAAGKAVATDRDKFGRLRFKTVAGATYSLVKS